VAAGGVMKSSVGRGLDFLVIADSTSQSTKAVKARSIGVKCIYEDDLRKMGVAI